MSPATSSSSDAVGDDEILLRRLPRARQLNLIVVDRATGEERLSSSVFKHRPDRDPDGLSVFRQRVLEEQGLPVSAVRNDDSDAVAGFVASVPRRLGLEVVPDPQPDDDSPTPTRGRAHALITGWPDQAASRRVAKQLQGAATLVLVP